MSRRLAALVSAGGLLALGGCSPEPNPFLAVVLVDDRPTLVVANCALNRVESVTLWEIDRDASPAPATEPGPPPYPDWRVWAPVPPASRGALPASLPDAPARLELLGPPPPGWQAGADNSLREFREDREYHVFASSRTAAVDFTLARLRQLKAGEVLSAVNYDERVESEEDFQKRAGKFC
ncbi:hypothetical protein [Paractinoplanes rishiriensis]|uniref:hypothetical protein n=1 Tax=Paractinoplanes rishiriensis TaxID=1050105 RepID=UPI001940975B|nr:hypothetical protein [Actinoplanes rishiriensis]